MTDIVQAPTSLDEVKAGDEVVLVLIGYKTKEIVKVKRTTKTQIILDTPDKPRFDRRHGRSVSSSHQRKQIRVVTEEDRIYFEKRKLVNAVNAYFECRNAKDFDLEQLRAIAKILKL